MLPRNSPLRKLLFIFGFIFVTLCLGILGFLYQREKGGFISPLPSEKISTEKPLDKYTIANLRRTSIPSSDIKIGEQLKDEESFSSYVFYFRNEGKKVSGILHVPKKEGTYPVIVMLRGFVDKSIYTIGEGSKRGGEFFAQNGFITVAPDFLGYGESENPSQNAMEERFQTYITSLSLLSSISNLNIALEKEKLPARVDSSKIGIWGHSNGGHIALAILAITSKPYPTVLWAPVSKPFPYSILYYTDEFEDHGKALRKVLADFEKDYDVEKYSIPNFFKFIKAPIYVFQGDVDDAIPIEWTEGLVTSLKEKDVVVEYQLYSGADHNLMPTGWFDAVIKSVGFYRENLK